MTPEILTTQHRWLITGVAGFIGSNLLEYLLQHNQIVVGVDSFLTGFQENLNEALLSCTPAQQANFTFYEGDVRDASTCAKVMQGIDIVLHQAAMASVPRSLETPELTHDHNVNGMMNLLMAAKEAGVKAFIYASSSSVYGDSPTLPKKEEHQGNLLSPYAASKHVMEVYADVFARCYDLHTIGIRYFNVFGPRQNKKGPYAAVIPIWTSALLQNEPIHINGDGSTSRDFTYISNVVHMNILAAQHALTTPGHTVYNAGAHQRTTLLELFERISQALGDSRTSEVHFRDFRVGDIRHSCADISRAQTELGYRPLCSVEEGIIHTVKWFKEKMQQCAA